MEPTSATTTIPDWLEINAKGELVYANTYKLEQRIADELGLVKYDGILMQDGEQLKESLEDQVYRIMRREAGMLITITTARAKEIAGRTKAMVESPIDNRNLISFKNKTIDFNETFKKEHITFLKDRVDNHNSVQWDLMTPEEIAKSPKHREARDKMLGYFKDWKINPAILFKIGAYAMCKRNFADKIFFFEGKGGEGKSEASKFIRSMFEKSASKAYNPINPKLGAEMAFVGTQIVYNDDLQDGKISLEHIKPAATGGDIDIRPMYQANRSYTPYSTMIFNTNHPLKTGNDAVSNALESRVFTLVFKGKDMRGTEEAKQYKKYNPSENKYFMDVFSSYCAYAIPKLIKEEFNDETSKGMMKKDSISSANTVKLFLDDFDIDQPYWSRKSMSDSKLSVTNGKTTIMALYQYYSDWAADGNEFRVNKTTFKEQFSSMTGIDLETSPSSNGGVTKRWIDISSIIKGNE